jgi:hypothetical protein
MAWKNSRGPARGRSPYNEFKNKGKRLGRPEGRGVVRNRPETPTAGENGREIDCKSHKKPIICLSKIYAIRTLIVQLVIEMVGCFSGVFLH